METTALGDSTQTNIFKDQGMGAGETVASCSDQRGGPGD